MAQLSLEVVNRVENSRVLLQKVAEGLRESLGLACSNLAQSALLVLIKVPVHLADLGGGQLGDAACANTVIP